MNRRVKAISLYQPWASAIAWGLKRIETRDWSTPYRGLLVIHAAKHQLTSEERRWLNPEIYRCFPPGIAAWSDMPRGVALCICELVNVVATDVLVQKISQRERGWGNYASGRYGWVLELVKVFDKPIPLRGMPNLFDCDLDALIEAKTIERSEQLRLL